MGTVQGDDGRAEAGLELQATVTRMVGQSDLVWQAHGPNYGGALQSRGALQGFFIFSAKCRFALCPAPVHQPFKSGN